MPQLANQSLVTTSGTHVFAARGVDPKNGIATLVEPVGGIPVADRRIAIARSRTPQGKEKIAYKITIPVVSTVVVGGVSQSTVLRSGYAEINFTFDSTSTLDERVMLRELVAGCMTGANTFGDELIDNLEYLY